jgi:hypothetical protein
VNQPEDLDAERREIVRQFADTDDADEMARLVIRAEELRRQRGVGEPAPKPDTTSWIGDVAPALVARFRAEEQAAIEHAAGCTARPCERCARFVCRTCETPVNGATQCRECSGAEWLAASMKPTTDSIPPRFQWAVNASHELLLSRVRGSAALLARGITSPPSTNLLFTGETGAGKTSLAVAMLAAWVRAEPSARRGAVFVEASWLSRARARHKLGQGECELVETCFAAPLLLLDDLGQEREDRDGCITDVVYKRSSLDLPTWVTCGLAGADLGSFAEHLSRRYDGGFVRRILETGKRVELGR